MFELAEFVLDKVKPKVMWGENAPGLFTSMGQGVLDGLRRLGARHGYSFSVVKTNSQLHGLPQRRKRTFYFFWNSPTVPQLPPKKRACKSFADFLQEIPKKATQQDLFLTQGKASERFRPYQLVLDLERVGLTHPEVRDKYKKKGAGT